MATVPDTSVTIIGESVQVRGNLSGDEDLHVLGRVEGSLDLERTLVVAESGVVKAEVTVKNAVISGVVVGNIHARESVEITREGRMVGDISSPRVIIVDGASFRGNVDMGDVQNMPARPPRRERPEMLPRAESRPAKARDEKAAPAAPEKAPEKPEEKAEDQPADDKREARPEAARTSPPAPAAAAPRPAAAATPPRPQSQPQQHASGKSPGFMNPPQAKGLPTKKKQKSRVVVKRR